MIDMQLVLVRTVNVTEAVERIHRPRFKVPYTVWSLNLICLFNDRQSIIQIDQ